MRYAIRLLSWDAALTLLIVLEMGLIIWTPHRLLSNGVNEVCYTLCSLLIGLIIILKYWGKTPIYKTDTHKRHSARNRLLPLLLLSAGFAAGIPGLIRAFREMPIGVGSDIIPTIEVAVRRLLAGDTVYQTIDLWGYQLPLTYLPMQWLPYIPAELLHFDYRWIAVGIFYLASALLLWRCSRLSPWRAAVAGLLLLNLLRLLLGDNKGVLAMTVEMMVTGYYMLLIMGLMGRNAWLRGAAIALCLLSRYSLILWLPLWAAIEWLVLDKKNFYRSTLTAAALVLCIYIIPFLSHDWGAFLRGYHYYTVAALGEWSRVEDNGVPYQLNQGIGFARLFFLKLWHYSIPDRLHALQKVHFVLCLGSTIAMGLAYFLFRRRLHPRIFLLASFKIYLSLFLAFIQVPYTYLMIPAAAVSIAIFAELGRWQTDVPPASV